MNSDTEIRKRDLEKSPISQLVFYMTSPEYNESLKLKAEGMLYKRLTKKYKLAIEDAKLLAYREKETIATRGYDLSNYVFGEGNIGSDKLLETFYENVDLTFNGSDITIKNSKLTASELVFFGVIFGDYQNKYASRQKKITELIKNNNQRLASLLKKGSFSEVIQQEISKKEEINEELRRQMAEEEQLNNYYKILWQEIICKYRSRIGYKDGKGVSWVVMKEFAFYKCIKRGSLMVKEMKQYYDISWDAYEHDTALLKKYGIFDDSFSNSLSKKKEIMLY